MKKGAVITVLALCFLIIAASLIISATPCSLDVKLMNQEPYPAVPGEYVNAVFEVRGTANAECGEVTVELNESFPFSIAPGEPSSYMLMSGFFRSGFNSSFMAPFKIKVDPQATENDNELEVKIGQGPSGKRFYFSQKFEIEIEDVVADFEVYVKDYDPITNIMVLEILNTGKADISSLTLTIPQQENIEIKGANVNIIGDLDSNDYTTAEFEAVSSGGDINLEISYSDKTNTRRNLSKIISFDPDYFKNRKESEKSRALYYVLGAVILVVLFFIYRIYRKNKKKHFSD